MRVASNSQRGSLQFNMTPMIDVTFLLIVFFLVSSHLARQETQLEMALPTAGSGRTPSQEETRRVTINVLSDGRVLVAAKAVDRDELIRTIQFESNKPGRELEVRIRADRGVPYRFVEPILLACARGDVWNVTFAVVRKEPAG